MFLHASFLHVAGNMLFLWIFGDNVEDYLGHFRYLLFYLASGVAAGITHILLNAGSPVPSVGASGAIAGVMGAYFVLYPRARVLIWFPPIFLFHVPAWLMLGYWFFGQFLSGAATSIAETTQTTGGIAFWAHVGGFVAGVVMIKLLGKRPHRYRYGTW
jgi:membrane associated rhomboid family serine protease